MNTILLKLLTLLLLCKFNVLSAAGLQQVQQVGMSVALATGDELISLRLADISKSYFADQ
jgi:3-deoxy-D-manno-octulosonate 8-phosphate phosphatase KdsC-like HAD superfamily phosphatase